MDCHNTICERSIIKFLYRGRPLASRPPPLPLASALFLYLITLVSHFEPPPPPGRRLWTAPYGINLHKILQNMNKNLVNHLTRPQFNQRIYITYHWNNRKINMWANKIKTKWKPIGKIFNNFTLTFIVSHISYKILILFVVFTYIHSAWRGYT